MEVLNDNSTSSLAEKAQAMMSGKTGEVHHDFFAPLGDMDPMVKKPFKELPPPKFCFRVFTLAGAGACPEEANEYIRVMNEIVGGNYFRIEEQTYHTKDGDIQVLLRWLEISEEELKLRETMKQESQDNMQSITDEELKAKDAADKEEKKEEKQKKKDELAGCPAPDPEVVM